MKPHRHFLAFFAFLLTLMFLANSRDWWLDIVFFALLYAILWLLCAKYRQSATTLALLILIPVPHLLGAFGLYHWGLGGLSWDIIGHITTSFLGVLLLQSALQKLTWKQRISAIIIIVLCVAGVIELIEWAGGEALHRQGEGLFYRGAGDYCTDTTPCTAEVDTAKDMIDNITGMVLGIFALAYAAQSRKLGK